jgi:hypothetical protein
VTGHGYLRQLAIRLEASCEPSMTFSAKTAVARMFVRLFFDRKQRKHFDTTCADVVDMHERAHALLKLASNSNIAIARETVQ